MHLVVAVLAKIHQIIVIKCHVRVRNVLWVKFMLVMHYVSLRLVAQLASPSVYRYAVGYKRGAALSPRLMSVKTLSILFSHQSPCAITMAAVAMSSSMSMAFAVSPRSIIIHSRHGVNFFRALPDMGTPLPRTAFYFCHSACTLYRWRVCVSTSPKPSYYFLFPLR